MENKTVFDQFSSFVFGTFDRVSQGVATYFDGAIAFNEAKAALNASKAQKDNLGTVNDLATGSAASTWGDPDGRLNLNLNGTQGILVLAGVGLAVYAIARAK